jgi:uncharacterized repeat protein (TIGR01451 family)
MCLVGVLTAAAVAAAPGTASGLDGCGAGTTAARTASAPGASSAVARTGGTALSLSTSGATVGAADPTEEATDDPSPGDRPTDEATGSDPGGADPSDPAPTTDPPDETENPGPTGGPAEPVSLSVAAEASPTVVQQGDTVVLTIVVSNDGPGDDPGVVVDPQIPDGFAIQRVDGVGFDESSGLWEVGELVAGDTKHLTMTMTVTAESDHVSAGPTVTGEAADPLPMDDQDCATVEVQPSSPGGDAADPGPGPGGGDGPRNGDDPPATSADPGSTPPDRGDPSTGDPDPTAGGGGGGGGGRGDTTTPPGTPDGSSADAPAGTDPPDETTAGGGADDETQTTSEVGSDRTSSEAALMMLAWMLVVAGVVLLVLGRLTRRKRPAWYV